MVTGLLVPLRELVQPPGNADDSWRVQPAPGGAGQERIPLDPLRRMDKVGAVGLATTVTTAVTRLPPNPASAALVEACTLNPNALVGEARPDAGVKRKPAWPCANVMKVLLLIGVVPLFWKSKPF